MKVSLLPYCEIDGIKTITDSQIRGFYDRMCLDGVADMVFHAGDVKTRDDFLNHMKSPSVWLFVVEADKQPAGLIWLTHIEFKTCRAHFTVFGDFIGDGSVDIGREAIRTIMFMRSKVTGDYLFDVIQGLIPAVNFRAVKWVQKVGLNIAATIPNAVWWDRKKTSINGVLLYLTRELMNEKE